MDRQQQLAELERLLAAIRSGAAQEDATPLRPSVGLPAAYEYTAGTQYQPVAPRAPEMPSVASGPMPVLDQSGRLLGYSQAVNPLPTQQIQPKIDVLTQRMVGGGILLLGGGVGGAFLLNAAAAAVVPLALIAVIVVSLAYMKHAGKSSGGGSNVNVNVNVRMNQRNG